MDIYDKYKDAVKKGHVSFCSIRGPDPDPRGHQGTVAYFHDDIDGSMMFYVPTNLPLDWQWPKKED